MAIPWVTECSRCGTVWVRGMSAVCGVAGKRTPRGRVRMCQGGCFRRRDLEDALRAADLIGGFQALLVALQAMIEVPVSAKAVYNLYYATTDEGSST